MRIKPRFRLLPPAILTILPPRRTPAALLLILALWILAACHPAAPGAQETADTVPASAAPAQPAAPPDTQLQKIAGGDTLLLVPGKAAGKVLLKAEVEKSRIFDLLGPADSGDAAMCKSWAMWYWGDTVAAQGKELDIYSVCDPDIDMRKSIQLVRVSGVPFRTATGLSENSAAADIRRQHPHATSLGRFKKPDGSIISLLDDVAAGITFELAPAGGPDTGEGRCTGADIHLPGKKVTDTYIPFYTAVKQP
ncbi:hypothetical protein [Compostibacter hankyongensis]|uniref:DUF3455 domain-containing protein n=1 Tax=Compostibacter hankyongensis TaxID=1007089 RepID=A0ABP8FCS2_9BACT